MSYSYNHATLVGRLAKDPEFIQLDEEKCILKFRIAIGRTYQRDEKKQQADFIPVALWGKTAELGKRFLKKGTPVLVWGRIQVRTYEHEKETKWMTEISAENFQVLEKLKEVEEVVLKAA